MANTMIAALWTSYLIGVVSVAICQVSPIKFDDDFTRFRRSRMTASYAVSREVIETTTIVEIHFITGEVSAREAVIVRNIRSHARYPGRTLTAAVVG